MNFTDPSFNLEKVPVQPGQTVADFGAGSGSYSLEAARQAGSKGRVLAVEIQKELLDRIKNQATERHLGNVEVIWGNVDKLGGSRLADRSVDVVIASNILFQVDSPYILGQEVKRVLRSSGRLLVVDWLDSFSFIGPPPDQVVGKESALEIFAGVGFKVVKEFSAGPYHYGLVFEQV